MINNRFNYFAIPLAIVTMLLVSLLPNTKVESVMSSNRLNAKSTSSKSIASVLQYEQPFDDYLPHLGKSFVGFKEAVAFKESGGDYFTVNKFGYLGKYQFGKETLKMIGVYNPTVFLNSPELQEKAFLANLERNKWILRKDIKRFVGRTIGDVKVTESGMLAAAHLAGPGSVKKFLRSYGENNFSDAFGTSVTYYMKKFAGYDTSSIQANKRAKARI